jgi:hypothetical protein
MVHLRQQKEVGVVEYILLYLFSLPVLWNPWRYRWELEAYTYGSGLKANQAKDILKSYSYGWLLNGGG